MKQIWVMDLTDKRDVLPEGLSADSKFDFCFKNGIIGIGLTSAEDFSPEKTSKNNLNALQSLREVKRGDLIWIHGNNGNYYIAKVKSTITTADKEWNKFDISYFAKCDYYLVGEEIPNEIAFCKDLLVADSTIQKIEYFKSLFDFTEQFVAKKKKVKIVGNIKSFIIKNAKKIILSVVAVLLIISVVFGAIYISRYIERSKLMPTIRESLKGKLVTSIEGGDSLAWNYFYEFNEDFTQYRKGSISYNIFNNGTTSKILDLHCYIHEWQDIELDENATDEYMSLNGYEFEYNDERQEVRIGKGSFYSEKDNEKFFSRLVWVVENYAIDSDMSDEYVMDQSAEYEALVDFLVETDYLQSAELEKVRQDRLANEFLQKALDILDTQRLYGSSIEELLSECTKDIRYSGYELLDEGKTYKYTYSCLYAPNKHDMPNYYSENGTLEIIYNIESNNISLQGNVYDAIEVYAILHAYSY